MEDYSAEKVKQTIGADKPSFGPYGLNRHQRRALRKKLDTVHQQRLKAKPRKAKGLASAVNAVQELSTTVAKVMGLSALVLQAFIYYDNIIRLTA